MKDIILREPVAEVLERAVKKAAGWSAKLPMGDEAATLISQDQPIGFSCPVCKEVYATAAEARECRDQPYDTAGMEIGDIVVVPGAYHNSYDPSDPWVAFVIPPDKDSNDHFERAGYTIPYFVVTAVHSEERNPHRALVTLCSLAGGSLRAGWNPADGDGHYAMFKPNSTDNRSYWGKRIQKFLDCCEPCAIVKVEAAQLANIKLSTRSLL